jgi:hypothetical protein
MHGRLWLVPELTESLKRKLNEQSLLGIVNPS